MSSFISHTFQQFANFWGIELKFVSPRNPKANRISERANKVLKTAIRTTERPNQWMDYLPLVTLSVSTWIHLDTKVSATQAAFALDPLLPGQFLKPQLQIFMPEMSYIFPICRSISKLLVLYIHDQNLKNLILVRT